MIICPYYHAFVVSDIIIIYIIQLQAIQFIKYQCFWWGTRLTAYTVLLQYMLLCFIYFSKVKIAEFLWSFTV